MASQKEYTCPMHPEVRESQPGKCPICGMTLEPRVSSTMVGNMNRSSFAKMYLMYVLLALVGVYLVVVHGPHLYNFIPLLFLLCPLMHIFGHGGHGSHKESDEEDNSNEHKGHH